MRLEPYREAWHLLQSEEETGKEDTAKIEIQARADEAIYNDIAQSSVIPSEGADPRSGSAPQSRDLLFPAATTVTHLPASAAPWPIPPLKILTTRKTTQILPTPPK
jgi:hypothetical protein